MRLPPRPPPSSQAPAVPPRDQPDARQGKATLLEDEDDDEEEALNPNAEEEEPTGGDEALDPYASLARISSEFEAFQTTPSLGEGYQAQAPAPINAPGTHSL